MKKLLLPLFMALVSISQTNAQTTVYDSVQIGTTNDIWYSLPNDEQGTRTRSEWDLGFETYAYGVSILFNTSGGNLVYVAPGATIPAFSTLDTTGITTWTPLFNSDTSWSNGALNSPSLGGLDYGWGDYSTITNNLTGTRVFVIKYAAGTYKKFYIQDLITSTGNYTLVFSNLDNSGMQTVVLNKNTYNTKNFIYYSLTTAAIIDREPVATAWDLLFTKYTGFVPTPYTVTGVLTNQGVTVAQANGIANTATYTNYSAHTFKTEINEIGYDWKVFTGSAYAIEDSLIYFVHSTDSQFYKLIFTGYGAGKFNFNTTRLTSTSVSDVENTSSLAIYPNPASQNSNVTVLLTTTSNVADAAINVLDLSGRLVSTSNVQLNGGINQIQLETTDLQSGMYLVAITINNTVLTQKLVINK